MPAALPDRSSMIAGGGGFRTPDRSIDAFGNTRANLALEAVIDRVEWGSRAATRPARPERVVQADGK